ncbi:glutamate racemase [Paraferrimonas haliotis]|uniref:Glutamate racemase n=1 Tax=Paraferrimonas haliotis TaxID=2013866 RepID=A0AA37TYF8_9GAMM|nr:glutamate racemase [Paraferrimonas haliotis]GLS84894.1 glutamate racemase [Paraferrimonas haliotis]
MSSPLLVFDSGVGGLSILAEIQQQIPNIDVHYVFDNARLPYGALDDNELISGCVELICKQAKAVGAGMIVVACNTASTLVLPHLRKRLQRPVVGVVPAIKPAAKVSRNNSIAVLATPATIRRDYTLQLIQDHADQAQVSLYASTLLVELAERKLSGDAISLNRLRHALTDVMGSDADTIVLGCTHFPILSNEIRQVIGNDIELIDSGTAIAKRVSHLMGLSTSPVVTSTNCLSAACTDKSLLSDGLIRSIQRFGFESVDAV